MISLRDLIKTTIEEYLNEAFRDDISPDLIRIKPQYRYADMGDSITLYDTEPDDVIIDVTPNAKKSFKEGFLDKKTFIEKYNMSEKTFDSLFEQGIIESPDYLWHHYEIKGKRILCVILYRWTHMYYKRVYRENKEFIDNFLANDMSVKNIFKDGGTKRRFKK